MNVCKVCGQRSNAASGMCKDCFVVVRRSEPPARPSRNR